MVRLQGEGKFGWSLKNFSRLAADERIYSPPFVYARIAHIANSCSLCIACMPMCCL